MSNNEVKNKHQLSIEFAEICFLPHSQETAERVMQFSRKIISQDFRLKKVMFGIINMPFISGMVTPFINLSGYIFPKDYGQLLGIIAKECDYIYDVAKEIKNDFVWAWAIIQFAAVGKLSEYDLPKNTQIDTTLMKKIHYFTYFDEALIKYIFEEESKQESDLIMERIKKAEESSDENLSFILRQMETSESIEYIFYTGKSRDFIEKNKFKYYRDDNIDQQAILEMFWNIYIVAREKYSFLDIPYGDNTLIKLIKNPTFLLFVIKIILGLIEEKDKNSTTYKMIKHKIEKGYPMQVGDVEELWNLTKYSKEGM